MNSLNNQLSALLSTTTHELGLFGIALESTNSGIVITDALHEDNPIIFCNHAFENLCGYSRDEIIGKNCRFLQANERDELALELMRQAMAAGTPIVVEIRNYRKSGGMFWNEVSIAPVRNKTGQVTHFIGVQNDITAKKLMESRMQEEIDGLKNRIQDQSKQLARMEKMLFGILKTTEMCFVILEQDLTVIKANTSFYRTFGGTEQEIINMPFSEILNGLWKDESLMLLLKAVIMDNKPFESVVVPSDKERKCCPEIRLEAKPIKIDGLERDFILINISCLKATLHNYDEDL